MVAYMVKKFVYRIIFSIAIFFALTFFVFFLSNMMKGNAVDALLAQNPRMSTETYNALLHERGLDQPIVTRYVNWLTDFLHGDMGTSEQLNKPVSEVLGERFWPTIIINFTA